MKKSIILLNIAILSLLLSPNISAEPSDMFINHLTNLVWEDCRGKDIHINQPILTKISTNETFNLLSWPYTEAEVRYLIKLLGDVPYDFFVGTCDKKSQNNDIGWDGCGVITCGNNNLIINDDTYYWNGYKVDVPREEYEIKTYGDKSPAIIGDVNQISTGDHSPNSQQEISVQMAFGAGTIFGIILKFLFDIFIKRYWK